MHSRYQNTPTAEITSAMRRSRRSDGWRDQRIVPHRTSPITNTAIAVSSRVDSASATETKHHRQLRRVANHQANNNGVITNDSGWKLAQAIHWIGAYIKKA